MAKKQIITITSFKDAIPKRGVWYSYYDDIFVSVICTSGRKSHLRNKNSDISERKDTIMSEWHTNWQYNQIENLHGRAVGKEKTYEISIYQNGERHIIDSVIENVAIEFQHTLSVSVAELDSRWEAQTEFEYIPYLVLDFTKYSIPLFFEKGFIFSSNSIKQITALNSKNENDLKVISNLKKWSSSKHFLSGNLFIEFNDRIIRFHKELAMGFLTLDRVSFVNDVLSLEIQLSKQIEADILAKEEEIKEKERKEAEQRRLKDEEHKQWLNQLEIDKKERLRVNNLDKLSHRYFRYFREILNNRHITKNLSQFDFNQSIIEYEHVKESNSTSHIYFSEDFNLMLIYKFEFVLESETLFQREPPEIRIIRRVGNEIKTFTYGTMSSKIKEKKVEIAQGYLHSLKDAALIEYDEKGIQKKKSYYIHNQKIDEDLFQYAINLYDKYACHYQPAHKLTEDQSNKLQAFKARVDDDDYHFIRNIISNWGIHRDSLENYYEINEIVFQSRLKHDFYIYDQS